VEDQPPIYCSFSSLPVVYSHVCLSWCMRRPDILFLWSLVGFMPGGFFPSGRCLFDYVFIKEHQHHPSVCTVVYPCRRGAPFHTHTPHLPVRLPNVPPKKTPQLHRPPPIFITSLSATWLLHAFSQIVTYPARDSTPYRETRVLQLSRLVREFDFQSSGMTQCVNPSSGAKSSLPSRRTEDPLASLHTRTEPNTQKNQPPPEHTNRL